MNVPPIKSPRTDPVSKASKAYSNMSEGTDASSAHSQPRDQFDLSDESRLREEYALRLLQGHLQEEEAALLTPRAILEASARQYVEVLDAIRLSFQDDPSSFIQHVSALDCAWDQMLEVQAGIEAERLRRQSTGMMDNVMALRVALVQINACFATAFRASRPVSGTDRAIVKAFVDAIHSLDEFDKNELSLSDTMALLYYKNDLEAGAYI